MDCSYYDAARCRSCTLLPIPYPDQLRDKESHCRALLDAPDWEPTATGPGVGFRNKAKLVIGGDVQRPTLGILDQQRNGVDLRECGLHTQGLHDAIPVLGRFITRAGLSPYDVNARRGELKHVIATESPDGELMVRFVLRSREAMDRLGAELPQLLTELPIRVASVNLQAEHKAVLEGDEEIVLTDTSVLPMRLETGVTLRLRPRSFFQTNTTMATELYRTAARWVDDLAPASVVDLYCGVGGFALHLAAPGRSVRGVEISEEAVLAATEAAAASGVTADFSAGDATADAIGPADLVVVNPPRRGIGPELAATIEASGASYVLYSSCRAETLARDLASMPTLRPVRARVLDMFPHTGHYEVLTLLRRA